MIDIPEWSLSPDFLTDINLDESGSIVTGMQNAAQTAGWSLNQNNVSLNIDLNTLVNLQNGIGGGRDAGSSNSSFVRSELEEGYYQADIDFYVDRGFLKTIRTGVKYRNSTLHRETGNTFFLDPNFDIAAGEASEQGITRFDSYQWNGGMPLAQNVFTSESNIVGGFDINQMPSIDWDKYRDMVTAEYVPYNTY